MKNFLKDNPTLNEVQEFIIQDDPAREKEVYEEILYHYACDLIDFTLELRKQPGQEDYGIKQGFMRYQIAKDEALELIESINNTAEPTEQAPEALPQIETENYFIKTGEYWDVSFEGKSIRIRESKGVVDIAYLLESPYKIIEASVLKNNRGSIPSHNSSSIEALNKMGHAQLGKENLTIGPLERKTQVKSALKDLQKLRGDIERAKGEGDHLYADELEKEYYNKLRDTEGRNNGIRIAVTNRINNALKKIRKEHLELWKHLHSSISTGHKCQYNPPNEIHWDVKF